MEWWSDGVMRSSDQVLRKRCARWVDDNGSKPGRKLFRRSQQPSGDIREIVPATHRLYTHFRKLLLAVGFGLIRVHWCPFVVAVFLGEDLGLRTPIDSPGNDHQGWMVD